MIRNITKGRTVYKIRFDDPLTLKHRPHVHAVTILDVGRPLLDGSPVAFIEFPSFWLGTVRTEAKNVHLYATPEAAANAYRREWGHDCEPLA